MDDFALFTTRPQGNSAPMASSRSASTSASTTRSGFHDVFSIPNQNPAPMYDKPVYDDDVFDMRSSAKVGDDLLGSLGGRKKRSEEEELIPGFGSPARRRELPETNQQKSAGPSANHSTMPEDPFVVLETNSSGVFTDPLEHLGRPVSSGSVNIDPSSSSGGIFEDDDAFDGIAKSVPAFTSNKNNENLKERSPMESFENVGPKTRPKSFDSRSSVKSPNSNYSPYADQSPKTSEHLDAADEVWLNVSEIPLFTQPSTAPPPSRHPPPVVIKSASVGKAGSRRRDSEVYSGARQSYPRSKNSATRTSASPIDELEDFAMGKPQTNERANIFSNEEDIETKYAAAASAAAMKDAMDKAEAKFKHAKEVRERDARSARNREFPQQENDLDDLEDRERQEKIEREDREREQRRRQREKAEIEREKAKQAVERATREARERAAAEARTRAERAAVERVNAEARQRAERAAVQRAASEARERAAMDARERAERAAVEARERAASEARIRAERAAAAAREKQHKAENDLESFFGMGPSRANSAPKQRATTSENVIDTQAQSRGSADGPRWASSNSPSSIRKAATTIVDDLSSIFGGASSSGEFQEVEGETEERRRARLERHQRTLERAAKALAEKNERDMQTQRDQAERHRISETLDYEIKRWAAGKESNLRALLSTLQYVLWPECGWQPVSLTDLITAVHVKKAYRKATLCIHPDKVQQKGANLQQKYIAEKVFDLLKEAWNKFNSEELF